MKPEACARSAIVLSVVCPAVLFAQEPSGCFDVLLGPWSAIPSTVTEATGPPVLPDQSPDSVWRSVPSRIRFSQTPGWRTGTRRIETPEGTLGVPMRFQTWAMRGDTAVLAFSSGFSGTVSRVTPDASEWRGEQRSFADALPAIAYRRDIQLTPVDCSAEPVVAPPLLRRLEIEGWVFLELGSRLPDDVRTVPRQSGALTALVHAVGVWAGHDTVVVRLAQDGTVHHLELRYPEGHDLTAVLDSLHRTSPTRDENSAMPRWQNRTTTVFLQPNGRPRVVLMDPRYF